MGREKEKQEEEDDKDGISTVNTRLYNSVMKNYKKGIRKLVQANHPVRVIYLFYAKCRNSEVLLGLQGTWRDQRFYRIIASTFDEHIRTLEAYIS